MQAYQAILSFSEAEKPLGDRLIKIAVETDRVEGYSEPHAIAIARMAERIGAQMGLHGIDLTALKFAALAHDLGERAMKRNYLLRPGVLTWEETLDLWRHPILGEQAAGELRLSRQTQLLIRWHHEWWNGGGYPDGLEGEAIPLGALILRPVDSYFALISNRPHRSRYDRTEAEQVVADLAGIEFDPQVVKLMLAILAEERRSQQVEFPAVARETENGLVFVETEPEVPPEAAMVEFAAQPFEPRSEPEAIAAAATIDEDFHAPPHPATEPAEATQTATTQTVPPVQPDEPAAYRTQVEERAAPVATEPESAATGTPREAHLPERNDAPEPTRESVRVEVHIPEENVAQETREVPRPKTGD